MINFRYRAVSAQGVILRGQMLAADEGQLAAQLREQGYDLLAARAPRRWTLGQPKPDAATMALLFTQLAALAAAGVPLADCLRDTRQSWPDGVVADALRTLEQDMQRGDDLTTACARQPRLFSASLIAVLQAGMAGGNLAQGFAKARDHLQWQADYGALLRRATRYPFFLLLLCAGVIGFMFMVVLPPLVAFLRAQDYALPWHSQVLIWLAEHFSLLGWLIPLLVFFGALLVLGLRRQSVAFAQWSDGLLLRLPLFGALLRQRESAVFLHHLALLVGGGVPLLPAMRMAQAALQNRALIQQTTHMIAAITGGADLSTVWAQTPAFGGLIARRAQIGLQTGTLAAQLQQASTECDAATIARSKALIGGLEPALTILVALILGWIVLAVLGPLYGALGTLNR